MNRIRFLRSTVPALALALSMPALAQNEIVASANPDADRLAGEVRRLAADPRDVIALLDAGDLSARLGDTSAALAFFARAEAVDPTNPRILSGRAATLVKLERPGEALRLFQQAEARGLRVIQYASDRGLAYDLLGSPDLAQRDYKTALNMFRDDETVRRYALSLGITGDTEEAMQQLDPLLRRSDRAAWRARAFILAMNGDVAGADRIASTMMPGNMGASLAPFFRRLGGLSPADRAFAVHFGELSPTQARLADARMAPALPRYAPPSRPVEVATAAPVAKPQPEPRERDRRSRRERERDAREAEKLAETNRRQPVQVAVAAPPLPAAPQYAEREPVVQPVPTPTPTPAPVQLASRTFVPAPERVVTTIAPAAEPVRRQPEPEAQPAPAAVQPAPAPTAEAQPAPAQPAPAQPTPTPAPSRIGQEDTVLASIIGGLTIPGDELAAVNNPNPPPVAAEPAAEPVRIAEVPPQPAPETVPAAIPEPKPAVAKPEPKPAAKPAAAKADSKVKKPDLKAAAKTDPKAKKPDPKKPDPKKPDPAKGEPSRVWVQVAGGANEASLAKAWKGVAAKAPAAMKGKTAWSTPLRATNRVLAGPFKSSAEAQAFVNTLSKSGVSAFAFTSEAGQKITRMTIK